jgi:hypothetical protein
MPNLVISSVGGCSSVFGSRGDLRRDSPEPPVPQT